MSSDIKKIKLSDKEDLRAEIKQWQNRSFVDLRVWTAPKTDEAKWPTGKGFLIPVSRVTDFIDLMDQLNKELKESQL